MLPLFRTLIPPCLLLLAVSAVHAREVIRLASSPALSPDGATLAFEWNGDIWAVPTGGGQARPVTLHSGRDSEPRFSPDGKEIAFISDREGGRQVHVVAASGGAPKRLTYHTSGYNLLEWCPDGKSLLVSATRDHAWRHAERFFTIGRVERPVEELLFDGYGSSGTLSPDGKRLLFTREGEPWWRKGYRGSQASQVWLYDVEEKRFTRVLAKERSARWPLWRPDGKGFYYVGSHDGYNTLSEYDLELKTSKELVRVGGELISFPCISRDGSVIVYRQLFDLYRYNTGSKESPRKINLWQDGDRTIPRQERRALQSASQAAFTGDGLEIALIAGGDLWVMDTELREPKQVTKTAEEERYPVFAPDGQSLLFVSDAGGKSDVWKAERVDKQKYWWQNGKFKLTRLTQHGDVQSSLRFTPDGKQLAYITGRGDLWLTGADGKGAKCVLRSWNVPDIDFSPDGKWLVYAQSDNDFNRDVWLMPLDGSAKPLNVSRDPYNESDPVWSPDGRMLGYSGRRASGTGEVEISIVYLYPEDMEKDARDRALEKALEKMKRGRKPGTAKRGPGGKGKKDGPFDLEDLHDRIRRVRLGNNSSVSSVFWSPDSKKLAFTGSVEGRSGTWTIDPTSTRPSPSQLSSGSGSSPRWLKQGNQIVWLSGGVPASLPASGGGGSPSPAPSGRSFRGRSVTTGSEGGSAGTAYRFTAVQEVDLPKRYAAAFAVCWRTMRDHWYDERLGNKDWEAVRKKYIGMAGQSPDMESFATVVSLMLGELNGSHLGFMARSGRFPSRRRGGDPSTPDRVPPEMTAHLGIRFDPTHAGPGLRVRDVLRGGPAAAKSSEVLPGEVVLAIDNVKVGPRQDLTAVLNGPANREVTLRVRNKAGKERDVTLRPSTFTEARRLLYEKWLRDNRKMVEKASKGTLGYLHISAMNMSSFHKFEEELYSVGAGKDGLVIDVRENGGGSTADHLLTALTQPVHAITVPRGGGAGYPQDRKVYATWNRPIIVLCNQNSFSNAEIFSHAIKTLGRGKLVGVPTAGGVISTGAVAIMDVGYLRLPFRGWFLASDGQDMELNGAVPDHIVWPQPGDMPAGKDAQLTKAVEVLLADVETWKKRPRPGLKKASERKPGAETSSRR
jgi:tricorn protease